MTNAVNLAQLGSNISNFTFRNKIINGAMVVQQRLGPLASKTTAGYMTDRWQLQNNISVGTLTQSQVQDAPPGFTYSTKLTVTSGPLTTTYLNLAQPIEGYNWADMAFGTSSAKSFTLSFWVKSSLAGTYSLTFGNDPYTSTSAYVTSYTVSSPNTWEYKTIVVPGCTTGSWNVTNGTGISFSFILKNNTAATTDAWTTTGGAVSGAANWAGTNGATFQVTGVQIEPGTVATAFEPRPISIENLLCYRYYQSTNLLGSSQYIWLYNIQSDASYRRATVMTKATMRAAPTITQTWGASGSSNGSQWISADYFTFYTDTNSSNQYSYVTIWAADAEL